MSKLDSSLGSLGLQEYSEPLVSHGFETWDDVMGITEESLAELGFKLGHRRKLQREIASCQGQPYSQPLPNVSPDASLNENSSSVSLELAQDELESGEPTRSKRKYRRRRPKDPHAPLRPKSDYVLFANFLRQNPLVSGLPFAEISKLVGKQWQNLLPEQRVIWSSYAAQQKSKYNSEIEEYRKTDNYQRFEDRLRVKPLAGSRVYDENNPSGYEEQKESPPLGYELPLPDASFSSSSVTMTACDEEEHQSSPEKNLVLSEFEPSEFEVFTGVQHRDQLEDYDDITQAGQGALVAAPQTPGGFNYDPSDSAQHQWSCGSNTGESPTDGSNRPRSFHIQALNPFHIVSGISTWPYLDTFLQQVNSRYYCINAEYLVRQFNIAMDPATSLPNYTMCTLCICISIGYQVHGEGTDEMAIMWYENGRRYLDNDDWGLSLNVMRALALIFIFHRRERPTTARHYLDIALRIGEANHLSTNFGGDTFMDYGPENEWKCVWRTIQTMAVT